MRLQSQLQMAVVALSGSMFYSFLGLHDTFLIDASRYLDTTRPAALAVVGSAPKTKKSRKSSIVSYQPYDGPLQRVFNASFSNELPCFPEGNNQHYVTQGEQGKYIFGSNDKKGMFYSKLSKCSSSTLAGIAIQIARNTAARKRAAGDADAPSGDCFVRADHGIFRSVMSRDKKNSMLWTFIREPVSREASDYFHFHVSRRGVDPGDIGWFKEKALESLHISTYMTG